MAAPSKPVKVYGQGEPDASKIEILMRELDIPHEFVAISSSDIKKPEYLAINPNGLRPAIHDPNTDIAIWESGPIIEYLCSNYDKEHRLMFKRVTPDFWYAKQWLAFQITGQGPSFGQAAWFKKVQAGKVPSAVDRYVSEVNRVVGVLETRLAEQESKFSDGEGPWLVGNKLSYADLSFVPWQDSMAKTLDRSEYDVAKYPHVKAWLEKMGSRPSVKDTFKADRSLHND